VNIVVLWSDSWPLRKRTQASARRFRRFGIARTYVSGFFEQRHRLQTEIENDDHGEIL
jgi:hypothetical protein